MFICSVQSQSPLVAVSSTTLVAISVLWTLLRCCGKLGYMPTAVYLVNCCYHDDTSVWYAMTELLHTYITNMTLSVCPAVYYYRCTLVGQLVSPLLTATMAVAASDSILSNGCIHELYAYSVPELVHRCYCLAADDYISSMCAVPA
eukprot:5910-Heterococcus_DN1.PRE.3